MGSGPEKDSGQNAGTGTWGPPYTRSLHSGQKSVQELEVSLSLSTCLTSRSFHFRWKIRQELTKLDTQVLDGATNLQKGLEKVRKARTTYGYWLHVDYHGGEGASYSRVTKFFHFLAG